MLRKENRHDDYSYRVADREFANPDTYIEEGSWITFDTNGKLIPSDGTKKSFLCTTSNRKSRNNIASQGVFPKGTFYLGAFEVTVENNADATGDTAFASASTYGYMTELKIVTDANTGLGILSPLAAGDTDAVVAYSVGPADATAKTLRIISIG